VRTSHLGPGASRCSLSGPANKLKLTSSSVRHHSRHPIHHHWPSTPLHLSSSTQRQQSRLLGCVPRPMGWPSQPPNESLTTSTPHHTSRFSHRADRSGCTRTRLDYSHDLSYPHVNVATIALATRASSRVRAGRIHSSGSPRSSRGTYDARGGACSAASRSDKRVFEEILRSEGHPCRAKGVWRAFRDCRRGGVAVWRGRWADGDCAVRAGDADMTVRYPVCCHDQ
jgi:hypothetical protein